MKNNNNKQAYKIPVDFYYHVKVCREAEIYASSKEEALKILETELENGADPTDYKYIEEFWEYDHYRLY